MTEIMNNQPTTFDLRKDGFSTIRNFDISTGKTISDLTGGILTGGEYDKPLIEELVLERLNGGVASLRYKIAGKYAPFPKNFHVIHLFNGHRVILEKTCLQSEELYILSISDNYTVVYNDNTVLKLERERGWYIYTTFEYSKKYGYDFKNKEFYLNDTDAEPLNLPLEFILERHGPSVGVLKGFNVFKVNSETSPIEPTVFYGPIMEKNCHYCMLGYTDDYETDNFRFTSIRRWRVTQ